MTAELEQMDWVTVLAERQDYGEYIEDFPLTEEDLVELMRQFDPNERVTKPHAEAFTLVRALYRWAFDYIPGKARYEGRSV